VLTVAAAAVGQHPAWGPSVLLVYLALRTGTGIVAVLRPLRHQWRWVNPAPLGSLRVVLPTHYADAWLGLLFNPVQTDDMVKGAISALAYATAFLAWAWYRFARMDIVS
jgi:hypothetical protein